jgi:hypothetical protein
MGIVGLIASRLAHVRKIFPDLVGKHFTKLDTPSTIDLM